MDDREWKPSAHLPQGSDSRAAGSSEAKAEFKWTSRTSGMKHVQSKRYVGHLRNRPNLLGELAVDAGLINTDTLDALLGNQKQGHARIGEMMLHAGYMRASDLTKLLSVQSGIPFIDLYTQPIDPTLCNAADLDFYINHDCVAWRWKNREPVYVAADPLGVRAAVEELEGRPCRIFFASPRAIRQAIQKRFLIELGERARLELARATPENSAQHRLSISQTWIIPAFAFLLVCAACVSPHTFVTVANVLFAAGFITIAALKLFSIGIGLEKKSPSEDSASDFSPRLEDDELPVYSILVPLFREASVLPILINSLSKLDYPASKLQILLIFEETDTETIETAKSLNPPDNIEFISVPFSFPLTKPKACNFALSFARGEFLVIFDAEDLPEPDQLRRAVTAFRAGDEKLACVQARLNYYNQFENWLTRQFTLEYAAYFDLLLPAFERLGFPIPLGGTSTHFRTSSLRKAGAWDPFNVTEDADLGMRLAMLGYKTGLINSTTYEEANCRVDNWLRQRSRWTKGWIQTYLVRMRHPVKLYKALGLRGFVGFQIVIGGFSLSNLVHPLFFFSALTSIGLVLVATPEAQTYVPQASSIAVANLVVLSTGYSISILAGMIAATQRGLRPLILSALAMPVYWLLISFGSYKALAQLVSRPFHWEKTDHGLSRLWAQRRAVALREIAAEKGKKPRFFSN